MDDFQDELDKMLCYLEMQLQGTADPEPVSEAKSERQPKQESALKDDAAMDQLREQLCRKGAFAKPISRQIHVSLYVMACTFFFMVPSIGSALLSYVWLRDGVDKPSTPT